MKWFHAARARLRLLAPRAADARIADELAFHVDMETERLMREQQLDRVEARRRALVALGGVEKHKEELRDGRGTAWLAGVSLDLKLGARMLAKYPGLTIVGGLAMAFGIWFGTVTFHMFGILGTTTLPLPDGDRIVKIRAHDRKAQQDEDRVLYDYQQYRGLRSVTDIGAYRDESPNVVGADGMATPAVAAEITASGFRVAPARPLHGRVLRETDESAGAEPVAVLGYELWRERFDGDPRIVGQTIRLGAKFATVVGVMPEGYAFPESHELWLPLRTDAPGVEPRKGPEITVFGKLAPGMTLENAQAEARLVSQRLAAASPVTHEAMQAHVIPYTQMSINPDDLFIPMIKFFVVMLVVVVCSTVALLLFARAASRETEIVVRSALGASRQRIVLQLFAEALVLAGVAAAVGLAFAQVALTRLARPYLEMNYGRLPFWYEFGVSPKTVVTALLLAVLGAIVAGVLPARKITRGLGARLRAGTSGGGGVSFGGVWTAVIVIQVALTVAFPAVVRLVHGELKRIESFDVGFRAQEYLGVNISVDAPMEEMTDSTRSAALFARFATSLELLRERLQAEPGVAGVTFVDRLPRDYHVERRLQVLSLPDTPTVVSPIASIHPSYFDVLNVPVKLGRAFTQADLSADARVVIVDQGFVDLVMPGRNPIGHRVRIASSRQLDSNMTQRPWYEIVGVAKELGMSSIGDRDRSAGVYRPYVPGSRGSLNMIVHGRGDPMSVAQRIRQDATTVDPSMRIESMARLDEVANPMIWFLGLWVKLTAGLTAVALLLSLSGLYSVLSYTVSRRTREIGVRVALGASAEAVIRATFRRPLRQLVGGVAAGTALIALAATVLARTTEFRDDPTAGLSGGEVALLIVYGFVMIGVCLTAMIVPTRRALKVQPTEALRAE